MSEPSVQTIANGHGSRRRWLRYPCAAVIVAMLGLLAGAHARAAAQAPEGPPLRVATIDVQGAHRLTSADVIGLSGVHVGDLVTAADLKHAAERMVATGLFTGARYHATRDGDSADVIFVIGEAAWTMPVVFDNFVWYRDAALREAIAKALPTFDGTTIPDTDGAIGTVGSVLTQLLASAHVDGRVEHDLQADLGGGNRRQVFRVAGAPVPICAIQFPQAAAIPQTELIDHVKYLLRTDYTRTGFERSLKSEVLPLYRRRGFMRAVFGHPETTISSLPGCPAGVTVNVQVSEGAAYSWGGAVWSGVNAFTPAMLDRALNMKIGEVADGERLDAGLGAVRTTYGRAGYLEMKLAGMATFDDAAHTVTYRMTVTEGAAFRMGGLTTTGLDAAGVSRLEHLWLIPAGAVFDSTRVDEFLKKVTDQHLLPSGTLVTVQPKANHATSTVDVALVVH